MIEIPRVHTDVRVLTPQELAWAREQIEDDIFDGNTLCDKIREIYGEAGEIGDVERREYIRERCLVVFCYAKKMDKKLKWYRSEYEVDHTV